jgi:hypothetical protein
MVDVQIMIDMAMGEKDKDGSQHIARYWKHHSSYVLCLLSAPARVDNDHVPVGLKDKTVRAGYRRPED